MTFAEFLLLMSAPIGGLIIAALVVWSSKRDRERPAR